MDTIGQNAEALGTGRPANHKAMLLVEVMAQDLMDPPFNSYPDEVLRCLGSAQTDIDRD